MGVQLKLDGMKEFREALRKLPEELAGEASHIVEGTANGVNAEVRRVYPFRSGNLVAGVRVTHFEGGKVAAGAIVKSAAKHAHLYEYGTAQRRTSKGANRGRMAAADDSRRMIPIVVKARRRMYQQLADLLRRNGFVVSGL